MGFAKRVLFTAALLLPVFFLSPVISPAQESNRATPEHGGIVFVGSSIFRYWSLLTLHMAPLPVLNRAVAGSTTQNLINRIDQSVFPYQPRIVVYYCGGNDVSSGADVAEIVGRTKRFIEMLHEKSPNTFFYYASMQKAPNKRDRWDVVEAVNREMESYSHQAKNVGYIDINSVLFDAHGNLRESLFLSDALHFRPDSTAYSEFAQIVKPILTKAWSSGAGLPQP